MQVQEDQATTPEPSPKKHKKFQMPYITQEQQVKMQRSLQPVPRQSCHHSPSHSKSCNTSCSPSCSASSHWPDQFCHQHTPFWYSQDSLKIIPAGSVETSTQLKGSLLTERASNTQVSFYTRLQLPMKNGTKLITMNINPGA